MALDAFAAFINTNGVVFPDTEAVNASGPSATDGTEFVKNLIDNYMFGVQQAMLDWAGLTPDGVAEAAGTAQTIEALQKGFANPPGVVTQWNLASDPGVTGHRALLIQGQGILRANYPELDAAVYVGDGNNAAVAAAGGAYYRADDAAGTIPNIAGIYLILPDYRGYFPRGLDPAGSVDPGGASRYLGDTQLDAEQGHIHYSGIAAGTGGNADIYGITTNDIPGLATSRISEIGGGVAEQPVGSVPKTDGVNGTPRTDSETRAVNWSTKWVIWY